MFIFEAEPLACHGEICAGREWSIFALGCAGAPPVESVKPLQTWQIPWCIALPVWLVPPHACDNRPLVENGLISIQLRGQRERADH